MEFIVGAIFCLGVPAVLAWFILKGLAHNRAVEASQALRFHREETEDHSVVLDFVSMVLTTFGPDGRTEYDVRRGADGSWQVKLKWASEEQLGFRERVGTLEQARTWRPIEPSGSIETQYQRFLLHWRG